MRVPTQNARLGYHLHVCRLHFEIANRDLAQVHADQAWPMHQQRFVGKGLPTDASPTQPGGSAVVSAVYCAWE